MNQGKRNPSRQIPLSLPHRPALERADFLIGKANAKAVALIDRWPDWQSRSVLLAGPVGSGKSHLDEVWCGASGAQAIAASALTIADAEALLAPGAIAIEDLHAGRIDEAALFHLLNLATERRATVLMTSRMWPTALPLSLDDLASRLRAAQPVELAEPDDDLLSRVITKLFADRQLTVDQGVVKFIVNRMERSLEAANLIVDRLDKDALADGRAVTTRFAAEALAPLLDPQADSWSD
jgi:chromosomal replication initiation ATPase DnaA